MATLKELIQNYNDAYDALMAQMKDLTDQSIISETTDEPTIKQYSKSIYQSLKTLKTSKNAVEENIFEFGNSNLAAQLFEAQKTKFNTSIDAANQALDSLQKLKAIHISNKKTVSNPGKSGDAHTMIPPMTKAPLPVAEAKPLDLKSDLLKQIREKKELKKWYAGDPDPIGPNESSDSEDDSWDNNKGSSDSEDDSWDRSNPLSIAEVIAQRKVKKLEKSNPKPDKEKILRAEFDKMYKTPVVEDAPEVTKTPEEELQDIIDRVNITYENFMKKAQALQQGYERNENNELLLKNGGYARPTVTDVAILLEQYKNIVYHKISFKSKIEEDDLFVEENEKNIQKILKDFSAQWTPEQEKKFTEVSSFVKDLATLIKTKQIKDSPSSNKKAKIAGTIGTKELHKKVVARRDDLDSEDDENENAQRPAKIKHAKLANDLESKKVVIVDHKIPEPSSAIFGEEEGPKIMHGMLGQKTKNRSDALADTDEKIKHETDPNLPNNEIEEIEKIEKIQKKIEQVPRSEEALHSGLQDLLDSLTHALTNLLEKLKNTFQGPGPKP